MFRTASVVIFTLASILGENAMAVTPEVVVPGSRCLAYVQGDYLYSSSFYEEYQGIEDSCFYFNKFNLVTRRNESGPWLSADYNYDPYRLWIRADDQLFIKTDELFIIGNDQLYRGPGAVRKLDLSMNHRDAEHFGLESLDVNANPAGDSSAIYWPVCKDLNATYKQFSIYRKSVADQQTSEVTSFLYQQDDGIRSCNNMAIDDNFVYWTSSRIQNASILTTFWRAPKLGGTPVIVRSDVDLKIKGRTLTFDDGYLYFVSLRGIFRMDVAGTQAPQLLISTGWSSDFIVYGDNIYIFGGGILAMRKNGDSAMQLVLPRDVGPGPVGRPRNLMAGSRGLYWNANDGIRHLPWP